MENLKKYSLGHIDINSFCSLQGTINEWKCIALNRIKYFNNTSIWQISYVALAPALYMKTLIILYQIGKSLRQF